MLTASTLATSVITRSWRMSCRAESWLGDQQLADDIPVIGGSEEVDRTLSVPERVTLTVPRLDRGVTWQPTSAASPLATYGQRLLISVGIDVGNGQVEYVQRGWYVITGAETDGDAVQVEALGLLHLIDEAHFITPYQPRSGQTFATAVRNICEPALTVIVSGLTDRAIPSTLTWDDDRMGALQELLNAWPAEATVTADGYLAVGPVATGSSVASLTDGTGGTVISWQAATTRDGAASAAVAQGQASDGTQLQGVAYNNDVRSPTYLGGPFNPLPVPVKMFSPLLTTTTQCTLAARTLLKRTLRSSGRTLQASIPPHPLLQAGDAVTVTGAGYTSQLVEINGTTLPLTPDGGEMSLALGVDLSA